MGKNLLIVFAAFMMTAAPASAWAWGFGSSDEPEEEVVAEEQSASREPSRILSESEVRDLARSRGYAGGMDEDDLEVMPQLNEPNRGRSLKQMQSDVFGD